MPKATLVCVWLLAACATGGPQDTGGSVDAAVSHSDASGVTHNDARLVDAPASADAQLEQLPADAGTGSGGGLFCSVNSDCTVSGECCVNLGGPGFCAPGTAIGPSICFPD
jgi:hypothetical protein